MPDSVSVSAATLDDLGVVVPLCVALQAAHAEAMPATFVAPDPDAIAAFLRESIAGDHVVLAASHERRVVGSLLAVLVDRPAGPFLRAGRTMSVGHIAVADGVRRLGVGRALLDRVAEIGRARGAAALHLESWEWNDGAYAFFEAQGFDRVRHAFRLAL